jgi:hypothetical protein
MLLPLLPNQINNAGKIIHSSNNPSHRHNGGGEEEEDDDSVSSGGNKRLNRYNRRRSTYQRNSMYDDSQNFDLLFNINLRRWRAEEIMICWRKRTSKFALQHYKIDATLPALFGGHEWGRGECDQFWKPTGGWNLSS